MDGIKLVQVVDFVLKLANALQFLILGITSQVFVLSPTYPLYDKTYIDGGLVIVKVAKVPNLLQLCLIVHKLPKKFIHTLHFSFFIFVFVFHPVTKSILNQTNQISIF
jgi:hypothetical protein